MKPNRSVPNSLKGSLWSFLASCVLKTSVYTPSTCVYPWSLTNTSHRFPCKAFAKTLIKNTLKSCIVHIHVCLQSSSFQVTPGNCQSERWCVTVECFLSMWMYIVLLHASGFPFVKLNGNLIIKFGNKTQSTSGVILLPNCLISVNVLLILAGSKWLWNKLRWMSDSHLLSDAVDLFVLLVDLVAHVDSHVFQVANDAADCVQILLHLILPCVVGYPVPRSENESLIDVMRTVS